MTVPVFKKGKRKKKKQETKNKPHKRFPEFPDTNIYIYFDLLLLHCHFI